MRRLIGRLAAFYGKHALSIDLLLIGFGAEAVKRQVKTLNDRLEQIEKGGMVPRDDLVTLRDLDNKVGPVLIAHEQALRDAGLLLDPEPPVDVEEHADGPEGAGAAVEGQPVAQEAPGAP